MNPISLILILSAIIVAFTIIVSFLLMLLGLRT